MIVHHLLSLFHDFGLHISAAYFELYRSEKVVDHVVCQCVDLALS